MSEDSYRIDDDSDDHYSLFFPSAEANWVDVTRGLEHMREWVKSEWPHATDIDDLVKVGFSAGSVRIRATRNVPTVRVSVVKQTIIGARCTYDNCDWVHNDVIVYTNSTHKTEEIVHEAAIEHVREVHGTGRVLDLKDPW